MDIRAFRIRHVAAVIALAMPSPMHGQEWHLSAQAGRIRSALDPAAPADASFALGLRFDDAKSGLRLTGGVPATSTEPFWGGIAGWTRVAPRGGRWRAGLDLAVNAFRTVDRNGDQSGPLPGPFDPPVTPAIDRSGYALAAQVLPLLGFATSHLQLQGRAGISRYAARFGAFEADRSVRLADAQLTVTPTPRLALMPVMRWFAGPDGETARFAGLSAIGAAEQGSVWGAVGRWRDADGMPWSAGVRLRLHSLVSLDAGARHDTFDPLFLQPAQTSWSVGLLVKLGRGGGTSRVAPPVPAAYVDGRATIRIPVSASRTAPSIAGDFNAWQPAPMRRDGDRWAYTVSLTPGVYQYAFVSATGEWFVPEEVAGRRDDGMGGHVAVLVVR